MDWVFFLALDMDEGRAVVKTVTHVLVQLNAG